MMPKKISANNQYRKMPQLIVPQKFAGTFGSVKTLKEALISFGIGEYLKVLLLSTSHNCLTQSLPSR